MAERAENREKNWLFKVFFLGALMKLAGEFVGRVIDVLGANKKGK